MSNAVKKEDSLNIIKENIEGFDESKKYFGISIRYWGKECQIDKFAEMTQKVHNESGAIPVFFPFDKKRDVDLSQKVMEKLSCENHMIANYTGIETMQAMGYMNFVIGVRLHALIFPTIMDVPVLGISYKPEIDAFLESIDQTAVCEYENIDIEKIIDSVKRLDEYPGDEIQEKVRSFRKLSEEAWSKIIGG
jgi:polysaccharide pyruvyl transferase WcaK-like protein